MVKKLLGEKVGSGAMGQAARNRVQVQVWLDPDEVAILDLAMQKSSQRFRSQFLRIYGLEAAKKILKKS